MPSKRELMWGVGLLATQVLIAVLLYSNSAHHAFHLDDSHSIVSNPALRSLDQIPSYFTDARTFSTLQTNVDYRPLLQASYALNYAAAGFKMPVWHWTQVALHVWCAFFLYLFAGSLLQASGTDPVERRAVGVLGSLAFLVHPMASGVVNYTSARSSELTAAFLLTAFYLDLKGRRLLALLFFTGALFTKVEAVAALAVFWALSVLRQRPSEGEGEVEGETGGSSARSRWVGRSTDWLGRPADWFGRPSEWLPYLAPTLLYGVLRHLAMKGIDFAGFAAAPDMTRGAYLCTQITAWWVYLQQWVAPVNLVADNMAYPVYRTPLALDVQLALCGWGLVLLMLWQRFRRSPQFALLAFSALALISPTSSVVPLSEMMNEHRPYLPLALVALIAVSGLVRLARALPAKGGAALSALLLLWLVCLMQMTVARNRVFLTPETYWSDVVAKAPSGRAHNNYGLALMGRGDMANARVQFEQSLKMAPYYSTGHINLAIVYVNEKRFEDARRHYDLAVEYDRGAGEAQLWRASFLMDRGEYEAALSDLQAASKISNDRYRVLAGMARAYAGLSQPDQAAASTLEAGALDEMKISSDIIAISTPFFSSPERREKGLLFFAQLEKRWPEAWWIPANQATLLQQLGRTSEGATYQTRADKLRSR